MSVWDRCRVTARFALVAPAVVLLGGGDGNHVARGQRAEPVVAATVAGAAIYAAEVDTYLERSLKNRELAPAARRRLRAEALEVLVKRRLVVARLSREGKDITDALVGAAVREFDNRLKRQKLSLKEYFQREETTLDELEQELRWRVGWRRFLQRTLTEDRLRAYFQEHRRELDGTQLRVRHILLRLPTGGGQSAEARAMAQAQQIRSRIVAGEIGFARAAREHSTGPSGEQGGDLGFIGRRGPMAEAFSRAAFALDDGEISPPVLSPHGVHLIQSTDVRPGDLSFETVRTIVAEGLGIEEFNRLAKEEREQTPVEYIGEVPYIDPQSGKLVPK